MHFMKECAQLTQKYLSEVKGRKRTIEWILDRPHWEQVWMHWISLAHYKLQNHYTRLEDAPEGLEIVTVMGETRDTYRWDGVQYIWVQEMTKAACKGIYGE